MAETNPVFRAVITAVDNATAVLDRIASKIRMVGKSAEMSANPWGPATEKVSLFTRALEAAHHAGHNLEKIAAPFEHVKEPLHEIRHGVGELKEHFGELGEKITEMMPQLAALGAGASLAGMFELTHKVAEASGEFMHVAAMMGATTAELGKLNFAAKMTDTPLDAMHNSMEKLGKSIGSAAAGKNKDAAALFAHLHIPLRDANGQMVRAVDILPTLQEAFQKTTDVTMRQRMAFAMFGRAGLDMMPLLMAPREEMEKWAATAKKLAYPFTKEDRENLEEFNQAWKGLELATTGVSNSIGSKLAPFLTPVLEKVSEWVALNREWIATGIAGKVEQLSNWVMKLDFDKAVEGTKEWVTPITDLVGRFVSLKGLILGSAAAMAVPWVAAAAIMVKTLGEIALAGIKTAWAIGTALVNAIGAAEVAMAKFNATALKNPLLRVAMLTADAFERTDYKRNLTQGQIEKHADIAEKEGFVKNPEGKWTYNGNVAPEDKPEAGKAPGWFERNSGAGEKLWHWMMGPHDGSGTPTNPDATPIGGHDAPAPPEANTFGGHAYPAPAASLFEQLRDRLTGSGQNGRVDVAVTFDGAPAGMSVTATGGGIAADPHTDVGFAFPGLSAMGSH